MEYCSYAYHIWLILIRTISLFHNVETMHHTKNSDIKNNNKNGVTPVKWAYQTPESINNDFVLPKRLQNCDFASSAATKDALIGYYLHKTYFKEFNMYARQSEVPIKTENIVTGSIVQGCPKKGKEEFK